MSEETQLRRRDDGASPDAGAAYVRQALESLDLMAARLPPAERARDANDDTMLIVVE